ncbi:MAG: hypothetical protein ER33_14890, partial [Cyanobium sp. CACIAM 14]
ATTIAGVGSLTINANGTYSFTPAANYFGPVPVVTYVLTDGLGPTVSSTLTLSVTPVNDPPVAVNDLASTTINTPVVIAVLANDSDVDGPTLTITQINGTAIVVGGSVAVTGGSVTLNANGTLTFAPTLNFSGSATFTYLVSDGAGGTATGSVEVAVGTNTPPAGADANRTIAEDTSYTLLVADFGFTDADAGQTLSNVRIDTLPAAGTLRLNGVPVGAGALISAADIAGGRLVFSPASNGFGNPYATFTFSVQDSAGAFDPAPNTLTFNVTPVNDDFTDASEVITIAEDSGTSSGNLLTGTSSPDGPVSITGFTIAGQSGPFVLGTPTTISGVGVLTISANGNYAFTPAANYNGSVPQITYTVSDGLGPSVSSTLSFTVTSVNDAPVNTVPGPQAVNEDTPLLFSGARTISVSDVDGNLATTRLSVSSGTLSVSLAGGALISAGANNSSSLTLSGSQAQINAALASLSYQGNLNFNGSDTLTVVSTDSAGVPLSDTDTVAITVNPVNDPPVAGDDFIGSLNRPMAGTTVKINVMANDSDVEGQLNPNSITLAGSTGPGASVVVAGQGTWSVNLATQEVSFTPQAGFFGDPTPIKYTIADLQGAVSNQATISIDYDNSPLPQPPVPPATQPRPVDFYLLLDNSTSMKGSDPSGVTRIEAQNRLAFEALKRALAYAGYGYSLSGSSTFQPFLESTNLTSSQSLATEILNYRLVDDPTDGSTTNAKPITIHVVDFGYLVTHSTVTFTGSNPLFGEILARDVLLTKTPDVIYGSTTSPDWIARGLPAPTSLDAYTAPGTSGNRYSGTEMLGALVTLDRLLQKELPGVTTDTLTSVAMITDGRPERRPWWDNRPDLGKGWSGVNVAIPTDAFLGGDPITSSGLRYTNDGTPIKVPNAAGVDIWAQTQASLNNTLDAVALKSGADNVNVLAIGMGDGGISNWNAIYTDLFTRQTFDASRPWNYQFSTSAQLPPLS